MKRLITHTLVLMLTFSLAACGRPTGVSQNTATPESVNPVNSQKAEAPRSESPVNNQEPGDKEPFIGLWHSMNAVAAGYGERYALNDDGTFIFGTSQMDELNRQLYAAGRWSIAEGKLKLEIDARLVVPEGKIEDIVPGKELIILDRGVIKEIYNPPEIETYGIAKTGADPETGRNTITIDGVTFYDFNNQTDMFDDYYDLNKSSDSDSYWGRSTK